MGGGAVDGEQCDLPISTPNRVETKMLKNLKTLFSSLPLGSLLRMDPKLHHLFRVLSQKERVQLFETKTKQNKNIKWKGFSYFKLKNQGETVHSLQTQ